MLNQEKHLIKLVGKRRLVNHILKRNQGRLKVIYKRNHSRSYSTIGIPHLLESIEKKMPDIVRNRLRLKSAMTVYQCPNGDVIEINAKGQIRFIAKIPPIAELSETHYKEVKDKLNALLRG